MCRLGNVRVRCSASDFHAAFGLAADSRCPNTSSTGRLCHTRYARKDVEEGWRQPYRAHPRGLCPSTCETTTCGGVRFGSWGAAHPSPGERVGCVRCAWHSAGWPTHMCHERSRCHYSTAHSRLVMGLSLYLWAHVRLWCTLHRAKRSEVELPVMELRVGCFETLPLVPVGSGMGINYYCNKWVI